MSLKQELAEEFNRRNLPPAVVYAAEDQPNGISDLKHHIYGDFKVMKDDKVVAIARLPAGQSESPEVPIVAFPLDKDHRREFSKAATMVRRMGTSDFNPATGSIGTFLMGLHNESERAADSFVQAHFKIRDRKHKDEENRLKPKLAMLYQDWRRMVLGLGIEIARSRGKAFRLSTVESSNPKRVREELLEVCREKGVAAEVKKVGGTHYHVHVMP